MATKIKVGDRVRALDHQEDGTVAEIVTYSDDSQKLRVQLDSGYRTLLPVELWRKIRGAK